MADDWFVPGEKTAPPASGGDDWIVPGQSGKGDRLPMAPGAVPHAMPADTVSRDLPTITPGGGWEGAATVGSRLAAGVLDIPGMIGDIPNAVDTLGSAAAQGALRLAGVSPEKRQQAQAGSDALIKGQLSPVSPLNILPGSEDVKQAVGFQPFQPQTAAGKIFDKYIGAGIEMVPGALATGGGSALLKTAAQQGAKAAIKQGTGVVLKQAVAPAAASEVAGDLTKGTPYEMPARLLAALAAGKGAGAKRGKVTAAPTPEEWRAAGSKFYDDMKAAGVGVKPSSFDRMVNDAEQALHVEGYRPALHPNVKAVLDDLKASKGVPQSFEQLDQMHRMAMRQAGNIDADTRRVASILGDKIDNYMENLKPRDLMAGDPRAAFEALTKGRDAWRKFRSGERIANIIQGAKDTLGANYTSAGMQTALRQAFKRFKWKGGVGKEYSREFKSLSPEGQSMVNSLVRGVSFENGLRLIGKFNIRNPFVYSMLGALGVTMNPGALAGLGLAAVGEGARAISARSTIAKATGLGDLVRGGQWTPGGLGRTPNPVLFGAAAQRATDQSK